MCWFANVLLYVRMVIDTLTHWHIDTLLHYKEREDS